MIEMQHVCKKYPNGVEALSDINITINKGEFVFLVGSSGAGKSTLVKMLIREVIPDRGVVRINGKDIGRMKRWEVPYLRRKIGVVFQDFRLIEDVSVFENVAFGLRVTNNLEKEIKRRVPEVLDMVGLSKKLKCTPKELSGGEQQRVCIARAIASQPSLVIADEPTGNLDPKTSEGIMEIFKNINIRGTTVVMATHAKNIVDNMQQRVIVMKNGALILDNAKGGYSDDL